VEQQISILCKWQPQNYFNSSFL